MGLGKKLVATLGSAAVTLLVLVLPSGSADYLVTVRQYVMQDLDQLAAQYMDRQVTDTGAVNWGSFSGEACYDPSDGFMEMFNEGPLIVLSHVWSSPDSRFYDDPEVLEAVKRCLLGLSRIQCWTGGLPVGREVESQGMISPEGVQLQDYGDLPHQFFLGGAIFQAYGVIEQKLDLETRDRIEIMLERLLEYCIIQPANYGNRSTLYEGQAATSNYYEEQIRVPKGKLETASRLDVVLRVHRIGEPSPSIWRAHVGAITLELDTRFINPNDVNPYREYTGWDPMTIAVWQVDDVQAILPYCSADGDDYIFNVIFDAVPDWTAENTYGIVRNQGNGGRTWISADRVSWHEWDEDLALQVWLYESNVDLVGTRSYVGNQEAGRFYLIHKARNTFAGSNEVLADLAASAYSKEVAVFSRLTRDGVFPEPNIVLQEAYPEGTIREDGFGGWSPGHGLLTNYFIAVIASESNHPQLLSLLQESEDIVERLMYRDQEGYKVMNSSTARDNNHTILSDQTRYLPALGFISLAGSHSLKSVILSYQSLAPADYEDNPYDLFVNQIDFACLTTVHKALRHSVRIRTLVNESSVTYMRVYSQVRLVVVKTPSHLYYMSYGCSTPSGGCITTKFNLMTKQHEVACRGASLDYGSPLHEIRAPDSSTTAWEIDAELEVISAHQIIFSGHLKHVNGEPTGPYRVVYDFLSDEEDIDGPREVLEAG